MPINTELATEQYLRYSYCRDFGHIEFLTKADKCDNFFEGNQWNVDDIAALKAQKRPALTINKILSTVSTVLGQQIQNRAEVTFRPASGAPPEIAETLTKVYAQIQNDNQLQWVRSDVFSDGIIRSRGFFDVRLDFTDSMVGEVRIEQLNSKNILIDPDAEEYDPDKWNDVIITKWMTPQDIEILYSKEDADLLRDRDSSAFPYGYDSLERVRDRFGGNQLLGAYYGVQEPMNVRRNIRTIDRQYHKLHSQKHFVDPATGDMRPIPDAWDRNRIAAVAEKYRLNVVAKMVKRIRWTVSADNVVLHDAWSPYQHFTVVPYFPHFRHGHTIGIVENLLGSQELLNKTSSQELHVINTTANSGWKVKTGALRNMSIEELEQSGAQTGLVLEMDEIGNIDKITPNQVPPGLERISYKAEEHIKSISGVTDSMQGNDREDVAAKAISYKQQQGSVSFSKVLDNLERTDWLLARTVLDLVQEYYTEERILNITHDNPQQEQETIVINGHTADGEITNDLTIGEYDIVITSAPFRATLEDSQFEQALAMREQGVQIPDSVLIENSRLMRKSELIKEMQAATNSPQAQKQQQLAMRQQEAEVAKTEADAQHKGAQAKKADAEAATEAQTPPDGGQAAEMQMKREQMQAEMQMKREQMEQEMSIQREKHQQEMQLRQQQAADEAVTRRAEAAQKMALAEKQASQPTREVSEK